MENMAVKLQELLATYGLKIIGGIAILIVGWIVAKVFRNVASKMVLNTKIDTTLGSFVTNLTYYAILTFVLITVLAQIGVETTSFIAIIGAAGLAIGLALQGTLSNFAAGVMIILLRPFRVGDRIQGAGAFGVVESVQIFTTIIRTGDNKVITVPNSKLLGDNITNYSVKGTLRVDMVFGIGYGEDILKVKKILENILQQDERVLKDPAPAIVVLELADSSVNIAVRPWAKTDDYWGVYYDVTESVKLEFDKAGVSIPFPQRDVHLFQN
ncbi:MAG: mechanosensitive ion channel [SAR324 cluster bacterium]|nr:mechanosensitive ion channel [SAR324 cluster bacterium]